jgi:CheY-like chemotaxis protein/nitrogen-specific signal transduction histidine kinase
MLRHFAEHSGTDAVVRFETPVEALELLEKELDENRHAVAEKQREVDRACETLVHHRLITFQVIERLNALAATITTTGDICYCTPAFTDLLRSSSRQLMRSSIFDYFIGDEPNQLQLLCRECIKGNQELSLDVRLTVNGSQSSRVRVTIIPLPGWNLSEQMVLTELLFIVRSVHPDIVEEKKSQQAETAEESSITIRDNADTVPSGPPSGRLESPIPQLSNAESVGWFIGGLAHGFNNALTAATCNISMALMELAEGDAIVPLLKDAAHSVCQATALTRQLLAFSQRQPSSPESTNIDSLIEYAIPKLERCMGGGYSIRSAHQTDCGIVNIDPNQFEMILTCLVQNARDAMLDGGTILIESANAAIMQKYSSSYPELNPGNYVTMRITDAGCGMTQEKISHLFDPFNSLSSDGKGTGLGLATCYTAVRQAGGGIEVRSQLGKGTQVIVYWPRVFNFVQLTRSVRVQVSADNGPETILVVEDEPTLRKIGVRILSHLGYRVLCASNGVEALDVATKHQGRLDLLFTDVVMPGMNGRELSSRLRKIRPDIKVLYTSGYTEKVFVNGQNDENSPTTGHSDYLNKPYLPETLAKRVKAMLEPIKGGENSHLSESQERCR